MAEAYDQALRRRLSLINDWGADSTQMANRAAQSRAAQGTWLDNVMRQPGFQGGGMRQPGFQSGDIRGYNGPRGNQQALIAFGKMIQGLGGRVSEHSAFNGGRRITGGHSKNSRHYSDRALDINFGPGTSKREQQLIDKYVHLAKQYGLKSLWRVPDHFNHWHVHY